jgi:cytidylate kinase
VRDLSYEAVAADIARRDALDSGRVHDPLAEAVDAVHVDTSELTIDGVVDCILELLL